MKSNKASLLTNNHKRNLMLLAIVPVVVFLLWSRTTRVADEHVESLEGTRILRVAEQTILDKSDVYRLLDDANPDYVSTDITEGLDGDKFRAYFSPLKERPVFTTVVASGGRAPEPEPEEPPEIFPTSVSFVYNGQNIDYAVIDGVLVKEGGFTPTGLILSTVESNRVLIKGKRSEKWITLEF